MSYWKKETNRFHCAKKWSFPLRISSVNMTEFAVSSGFGYINWRNLAGKLHFLCRVFSYHNIGKHEGERFSPVGPSMISKSQFIINFNYTFLISLNNIWQNQHLFSSSMKNDHFLFCFMSLSHFNTILCTISWC